MNKPMELFEIKCKNCGSTDIVIADVYKDSDFDEDVKIIKCANCHLEEDI